MLLRLPPGRWHPSVRESSIVPPPYPTGGRFARFTNKDPITSRGGASLVVPIVSRVRRCETLRRPALGSSTCPFPTDSI